MSGRPTKEDNKSNGIGVLGGVLLAGGAAAVGFLASRLWDEYKNQQENEYEGQCGSRGSQPPPRSSTSSWESTPRSRMEERKLKEVNESGEEILAGQKCIVCFDNPREVLLEPCNHVCLCENCAERVGSSCPVCRMEITRKREVFL